MRVLMPILLLVWLPFCSLAGEKRAAVAAPPAAAVPANEWLLRALHYDAQLSTNEARFAAELDLETYGKGEVAVPLFEGEVAVLTGKLPVNLRLVRSGKEYRLVVAKPGRYQFKLDLVARIVQAEPWHQVTFTGPMVAIASVMARTTGAGMELQMLSGTTASDADGGEGLRGFLGPDRQVSLRWQSKTTETARQELLTCETLAVANVSPNIIKYSTELRYTILQGAVTKLNVHLPLSQAITRLQGEHIRDWQVKPDRDHQLLVVEFIKPLTNAYQLTVFSEQTVEDSAARLAPPQPLVERENGSLAIRVEDVLMDVETATGLRQVNAPNGAVAAYQFSGRNDFALALKLRRIEPVIQVADRVSARLEEARLAVLHSLNVTVEKAGVYALELTPQAGFIVTDVRGSGVEDWKFVEGKIFVGFASRVLGAHVLEVQLELSLKTFPDQVSVAPVRVTGATKETAQIGVLSTAGIQLKTADLNGVREVPITSFALRAGETLAYTADRPDWTLKLASERQAARITAEIFNLITVGDGLVGGSATIRYGIINQGVQEFRVGVPPEWKNVEFTGANIRRKEQQTNVWTISLQDKAWGGYTLVLTYDLQFDPHKATLALGGAHALDVERENGSVAVTSAANVQLNVKTTGDSLRRVDENELSATDRALISRPVLLAFQYDGEKSALTVDVARSAEVPVLAAVADRTQITTVLTEEGQMLTQASFMVKNNDQQFQRFTLPKGATFWGCYVSNEPVKAERDGDAFLVPLPRGANRDEAFAVDIVYAQTMASFKTAKAQAISLEAPKTDVPNTYNEWELFVPPTHRLSEFGGNMIVQRGTTYELRDAWQQCLSVFQSNAGGVIQRIATLGTVMVMVLFLVTALRRGWRGAMGLAAGVGVFAIVASLVMPSLRNPLSRERMESVAVTGGEGVAQDGYRYAEPSAPALESPRFVEAAPSPALLAKAEGASRKLAAKPDGRVSVGSEPALVSPVVADALSLTGALDRSLGSVDHQAASVNTPFAAAVAQPFGRPMVTTLANGMPAAPAVAGIRPVHIDIPRLGERLVFTKVLNVGGESLALSTVAMEAGAWRLMQTGKQLAGFLAGLLVFIWQWRRARRNSFLLAIGTASMGMALGNFLLEERLLHWAFVAAVPLLGLVLFALILRRIWKRPAGAAATEEGAGASGAPATAVIVMACVLLSPGNASAANKPMVSDTNGVAITSASYQVTVKEKTALVEAVIELAISRPEQRVVLFGAETAVQEFACTQKEARLVRDGSRVSVVLPRRGNATVTMKFLVKHTGDVARRQLGFAIPPALISRLNATLDEPDAGVEVPSAVSFKVTPASQQTRFEAVIGAGERVEFSWTPRVKRAAEIAATVFCQNTSLLSIGGGVVSAHTLLDYQITQGELRQAWVQLPAGQKLMRVTGELLRTWRVTEEKGGQILTVDLTKGVTPGYRLALELEQVLGGMTNAIGLEVPHAIDVKRESGLLAIKAADELSVTAETTRDLQKVDAAEYERVTAEKVGGLAGVYRYLKPGFDLTVRVETMQPQIEAVTRNFMRIGTEQLSLTSQVDYTIKRAGVFVLRLALPVGYQVDAVTGEKMSQWVEKKELGLVEVTLLERVMGKYALNLSLSKVVKDLAPTLELVGVHPLETRKLNGYVAVSAEEGVQIKTGLFEGLSEIPTAQLPRGGVFDAVVSHAKTGILAYKFLANEPTAQPGWKLAVATEKVDSWVRAEVVNWVTVRDTLVSGRTLVRYDIANAPTKEFQLRVPPELKNVEITGADVRRRDNQDGLWRVELQHKQKGSYLLTVTWEMAWDIKDKKVPVFGIAAQGVDRSVERETGTFVFMARAPLQVAQDTASADLIRIDPGELPEWAGRAAETPALAYRYLRPGYQLSLTAQRFAEAEVLQALVESAQLTTVVSEDGQMMTQMRLAVRNNGRQFLEIALPGKNDKVWSAFVADEAVRPTLRDGKLLLPLERSTANQSAVNVEVTYVSAAKFPKGRGGLSLASPKLDVPLKNAHWELYLPPDFQYSGFAGSMQRELSAAPMLSRFTLASYSQVETEKRAARQVDAANSLSNARGYLATGNVKDANGFLNRAKVARQQDGERVDKELKDLDQQLRRKNADNIIAGQNAVTLNYFNANNSDGAQRQAGQVLVAQPLAEDYETAEQQVEKLRQAQEVAANKVLPLRVNLPQRGLRYSFSQVLQTEVGKEMTVQLIAADTRAINWNGRIAGGVAGFLLLWGLFAWTARRTSLECVSQ